MTFVLQSFEKIQHNAEYPGIGQNLETRITGTCPVHRNSPEQPKV